MQAKHGSAVLSRPRMVGLSMALALALAALVFASAAFAAGPLTVETKTAGGVNQTEATLNANVNPNNTTVTACTFEYGTTVAYGKSIPCNQSVPFNGGNKGVNAKVTGLSAGTTYHYRISATNVEGTVMGADVSFTTKVPPHETYVGGGDSLAFGYSQQLFNENLPKEDPHAFEHGYVNDYFALLQAQPKSSWRLTNTGCPAETTNSAIGNGQIEKALGGTEPVFGEGNGAGENGTNGKEACLYHNVFGFHLHTEYGGPFTVGGVKVQRSQLEKVMEEIQKANKGSNPDHPVTRVTFDIGANDKLHAVTQCKNEVGSEYSKPPFTSKYNPSNEPPFEPATEPPAFKEGETPEENGQKKFEFNLKRKGAVAFHNCVISHVKGLFEHILKNEAKILTALRKGSEFCVNSSTPTCDAGHKGVNYTGEIVFQGGYDPYGRVFCKGEAFPMKEAAPECMGSHAYSEEELMGTSGELVPESNNLTALLNKQEKQLVGKFFACFADPHPVFNPISNQEPARLQAWTNMDNSTVSNGKPNGDGKENDIHPTPEGYSVLANNLKTEAKVLIETAPEMFVTLPCP